MSCHEREYQLLGQIPGMFAIDASGKELQRRASRPKRVGWTKPMHPIGLRLRKQKDLQSIIFFSSRAVLKCCIVLSGPVCVSDRDHQIPTSQEARTDEVDLTAGCSMWGISKGCR